MDGFYIAKFKVEKRVKGSAVTDSKTADELVDEEFAIKDMTSEGAAVFDSDEDRPYLEGTVELLKASSSFSSMIFVVETKRRQMKAKGHPPPRTKKHRLPASTVIEVKTWTLFQYLDKFTHRLSCLSTAFYSFTPYQ